MPTITFEYFIRNADAPEFGRNPHKFLEFVQKTFAPINAGSVAIEIDGDTHEVEFTVEDDGRLELDSCSRYWAVDEEPPEDACARSSRDGFVRLPRRSIRF